MALLKSKGYKVIEQSNQGLAKARNAGVKLAKGRYILPLDSDNRIKADYIKKGIEILDNSPEVGVVYGMAEFFGERTGIWEVGEFDIKKLILSNYIDACTVIRKTLLIDCGGYDPDMPIQGYEDWHLWLTAAEKGWKFHYIPEVLFEYSVRSGSMVSLCNIPENRKNLIHYVCTKHLGLYKDNVADVMAHKEFIAMYYQVQSEYFQSQLKLTQAELEQSQTMIAAMHTSKFWRLRTAWFKVKRKLGLPVIE
jgi:glycosyltransferase involved in cell wall biosynthesis